MTSPRTTWKALLCGVLLFAAVDFGMFRSGLYAWIAKPESSAGWVTRVTRFDPLAHPPVDQPSLLLLGDSTMAEACDAALLRERLGGRGTVVNAAVPGSTPRVWPFLLPQVPVPPGGWRLVVVGLREYDDDGGNERWQQRTSDLAFVADGLALGDALQLCDGFDGASAQRDLWLSVLCKTFAWRRDLQDLFAAPWSRHLDVRAQFGRLRWGRPYEGHEGTMVTAGVDGGRIVGLPEAEVEQRVWLEHLVWRRDAIDDSAYHRRWYGELADRVTAAGAQIVLLRMPSQVLPRAAPRVPRTTVLDELELRAGVHVLPFETFAELERPECFYDATHLNRVGRERFSERLVDELLARFPNELGR